MASGARPEWNHAECTSVGRRSRRVAPSLLLELREEEGKQKEEKLNE